MAQKEIRCIRVSDGSNCPDCNGKKIVKNGTTKNKKQQYYCKVCHKRFIAYYSYNAYASAIRQKIILLTKEGLGIRSTARVLKISTTTLLRKILTIADNIPRPVIRRGKVYEVDEMRTYVKRKDKLIWIVYALERETRRVVSLSVGKRTNDTLNVVIKALRFSQPLIIYTDGLRNYKFLIDPNVHKTKCFGTNHIERKNLSLRTHLKRLNRKTICFSKSTLLLTAILKIYFWL